MSLKVLRVKSLKCTISFMDGVLKYIQGYLTLEFLMLEISIFFTETCL